MKFWSKRGGNLKFKCSCGIAVVPTHSHDGDKRDYGVENKKFFDYVEDDDSCVLETKPLATLAKQGQLSMYRHDGFWHCMDTYRDYMDLNAIWDSGKVPWKVWK